MLVAYNSSVRPERPGLEQVRVTARSAPFVDQALAARVRIVPGSRAGRRMSFRVIARANGRQEFRRVDFQRAIERGIIENSDHRWRLGGDDADLEFWATLIDTELLLAIRLTDDRMRHRDYKVSHTPASLRPSAAAALGLLSEPRDDDVVLDPFCGAGTVLIERAHLGRYKMLLGGDSDARALAAARENVGPRYKPIELREWDAQALPLEDRSVDKIITNLPWGRKVGSSRENPKLYARALDELLRVLKPRGTIVLLTAETRLMRSLMIERKVAPRQILRVNVLGAPAEIYVCPR
jgi:23S rRNA G2445 N2-methylase RlmL